MAMRVTQLYVYPVKSCRGIALNEARIGRYGIEYDRHWMIVTGGGSFLTQRSNARMALMETALEGGKLRLSAEGHGSIEVPAAGSAGEVRDVTVWEWTTTGVDQGDAAAEWISSFLDLRCRLVRIPEGHARETRKSDALIAYPDTNPFHVLTEETLAALNGKLQTPVGVERFRPNLVIGGATPHAEDEWPAIEIAGVRLGAGKLTERCAIPTIDQRTAERGIEPSRTLAQYRRTIDGKIVFGRQMNHDREGVIRVGDAVTVEQSAGASR